MVRRIAKFWLILLPLTVACGRFDVNHFEKGKGSAQDEEKTEAKAVTNVDWSSYFEKYSKDEKTSYVPSGDLDLVDTVYKAKSKDIVIDFAKTITRVDVKFDTAAANSSSFRAAVFFSLNGLSSPLQFNILLKSDSKIEEQYKSEKEDDANNSYTLEAKCWVAECNKLSLTLFEINDSSQKKRQATVVYTIVQSDGRINTSSDSDLDSPEAKEVLQKLGTQPVISKKSIMVLGVSSFSRFEVTHHDDQNKALIKIETDNVKTDEINVAANDLDTKDLIDGSGIAVTGQLVGLDPSTGSSAIDLSVSSASVKKLGVRIYIPLYNKSEEKVQAKVEAQTAQLDALKDETAAPVGDAPGVERVEELEKSGELPPAAPAVVDTAEPVADVVPAAPETVATDVVAPTDELPPAANDTTPALEDTAATAVTHYNDVPPFDNNPKKATAHAAAPSGATPTAQPTPAATTATPAASATPVAKPPTPATSSVATAAPATPAVHVKIDNIASFGDRPPLLAAGDRSKLSEIEQLANPDLSILAEQLPLDPDPSHFEIQNAAAPGSSPTAPKSAAASAATPPTTTAKAATTPAKTNTAAASAATTASRPVMHTQAASVSTNAAIPLKGNLGVKTPFADLVTEKFRAYENHETVLKYIDYFQGKKTVLLGQSKASNDEQQTVGSGKNRKRVRLPDSSQSGYNITKKFIVNIRPIGIVFANVANTFDIPVEFNYILINETAAFYWGAEGVSYPTNIVANPPNHMREDSSGPYQMSTDTGRSIISQYKSLFDKLGLQLWVNYTTDVERRAYSSRNNTRPEVLANMGISGDQYNKLPRALLTGDARNYIATASLVSGLYSKNIMTVKGKDNKKFLINDPTLFAMGYNAGEGTLSDYQENYKRKHGNFSPTLADLDQFHMASPVVLNYSFRVLAMYFIGSNPDKYGFSNLPEAKIKSYSEIADRIAPDERTLKVFGL